MSFEAYWHHLVVANKELAGRGTMTLSVESFRKQLERAYRAAIPARETASKAADDFAKVGRPSDLDIGALFRGALRGL